MSYQLYRMTSVAHVPRMMICYLTVTLQQSQATRVSAIEYYYLLLMLIVSVVYDSVALAVVVVMCTVQHTHEQPERHIKTQQTN